MLWKVQHPQTRSGSPHNACISLVTSKKCSRWTQNNAYNNEGRAVYNIMIDGSHDSSTSLSEGD